MSKIVHEKASTLEAAKKKRLKSALEAAVKKILQSGADADGFMIAANFQKGKTLVHEITSTDFKIGDWGVSMIALGVEARNVERKAGTGAGKVS